MTFIKTVAEVDAEGAVKRAYDTTAGEIIARTVAEAETLLTTTAPSFVTD